MNEISSIKMAGESDAYDIAYINAVSWQKAYRGIVPDEILDNISIEQWVSGWKNQLHNNAKVLAIYINNKIIGFAHICKSKLSNSMQAELNAIYLHPEVWGRGYGKELYRASLEELEKLGYKEIIIWVLAKNKRARQFYESLGFKESGISRHCGLFPKLNLNELQYVNKNVCGNKSVRKNKAGRPSKKVS